MSKKKHNQEIIDFRYYLIESIYPGSSLDENLPILTEKFLSHTEKELLEKVLRKYNIHFGIKYELG